MSKNKTKGVIENLDNIKFDHAVWLSEVLYSLQEIKLYENRLLKLIELYFGKEEQEKLGALFREFDNHSQSLSQIKNTIQSHIEVNNKKVRSNGEMKSLINTHHQKAREMINNFRKSYATLKERFHLFSDAKY